jgi:hypothetical protein
MLDLVIGPSYEDVYSIERVLLADRAEHQVLFLVNFSEIFGLPTFTYQMTTIQGSGLHKLDLYHSDQEPITPQPEKQWRTLQEQNMLRSSSSEKTPEHALPSNKEPSV